MSEMRFTALSKNSPMKDIVGQAIAETGGWSIQAMRAPGFRMLEAALSEERAYQQFRAAQAAQNGLRALAPLPDKAQVTIDKQIIDVGLQRLTFVKALMAAGLTFNLSDPLSTTQLEWSSRNRIRAAQRTMSPSARTENKLPAVLTNRLPIYLTIDGFELDIRTLKMSERVGQPLDVSIAGSCTRSVNEAIEDSAINGPTTLDGQALVDAGYSCYGLLNAPNANTQALTAAAWAQATANGGTVFAEVEAMISKEQADFKYGPYALVVGTLMGNMMDSDYSITGVTTTAGATIRERLLKIDSLKDIIVADLMPAGKAVLVQMTNDVVDMVIGQPPTVIPWTSLDGFTIHNIVMAIMIPRVRSDYDGNSGICIGTTQ